MERTVLYIIPTMNPDCFALGRRENANRYDLNRNFPDQFRGSSSNIQPETQAVMDWVDQHNTIISINYHGGSVVVSYPYDGTANGRTSYSKSPEDKVIKMMALEYASFNQEMLDNTEFHQGVTNGAKWYPLYGGMADWKYFEQGDIELTVELSYVKWPRANTLQGYWDKNKHSMINFLANIFKGVWGRITYEENGETKPCADGQVLTDTISKPLVTNQEGYYFRVLNSGSHSLVLSCGPGRNTGRIEVTISDDQCEPVIKNHHF
jgi:carboxypeptidase D